MGNRSSLADPRRRRTDRGPHDERRDAEADDLSKLARAFGGDAYDTWWTDRVKEIHGFDLRQPGVSMRKVQLVHEWKAPGSTG